MCFQEKAIVLQELYKCKSIIHWRLLPCSIHPSLVSLLQAPWVKEERLVSRASPSLEVFNVQLMCFKLEALHLGSLELIDQHQPKLIKRATNLEFCISCLVLYCEFMTWLFVNMLSLMHV